MILERPYNKASFDAFLKDFLPDYQKDERPMRTAEKSILNKVDQLGVSKETDITIIDAECEETDSNKRIAITQAAFKVLRDHGIRNALIAFHDGADQWRLSLLTSTLELKDGKVVKKDSNPRRYSYLLGVGAKTKTPYKYLVEKGSVADIKSLKERFSVEVVNKQFYESIADLFTQLVGGERGKKKYPGLLKIHGSSNHNNEHQEFAVRLIGRIIFSWFLKEKKSIAGLPIIPDELLSLDALAFHSDYYHGILEPLFFELLNKRINNRHESLRQGAFATVPYLNGGLFSPQSGDYYQQNSYTGGGSPGIVTIPDEWFKELFTVLEQYNFTVDENTSYDVDLSIDPEMLGRIFENLLAEINPETGESARKSTGSFYTPREIVDYMVDSSLLEYLKTKTTVDEEKLRAIISWGQQDDKEHPLTTSEKKNVVDALATLTILDPACGSGAFPIGLLQKVVYILQQVDEKAEIWLENQLKNVTSPELRRDIEEKYQSENYDWLRKLGVIRESIFGVDIQTIATEIAKLRCFLTLVIEEEVDDNKDNRGIRPLPNLDFKFVTANSLIGLPESKTKKPQPEGALNMFEDVTHIDRLKAIRNRYFGADADERAHLQVEFKDLQLSMFKSRIQSSGATSDLYNTLSDWNPFSHDKTEWFDSQWMFGTDKFDIVIANPPYFQLQKHPQIADSLSDLGYQTYLRSTDIYCLFFEMGLNSLNKNGVLTYITSNSWLKTKYGKPLRGLLTKDYSPLFIINFDNAQMFETAVVESCISVIKYEKFANELKAININAIDDRLDIRSHLESSAAKLSNPNIEGWIISSTDDSNLRSKIENASIPLKNWNQHIYIGLLNGLNEAYVIDTATKDKITAKNPEAAEIIKPMLRGRDVQRYKYDWTGMWMINAHNGVKNLWPRIDVKKDYPAVYEHLLTYKDKLEVRKNRGTHWTNLRNCAYFMEFDKPKIIWGELSDKPKFAYDEKGYIAEATLFALVGDNLKYLLGILNSKLALWYFHQIATSSGMGTSRWKKYKIESLPIAKITEHNKELVAQLETHVNSIINSSSDPTETQEVIDSIAYKLYGLNDKEIAIIENATT